MNKNFARYLKIALAVFFVLAVAFFVVKSLLRYHRYGGGVGVLPITGKVPTEMIQVKPQPPVLPHIKEARVAIILDDWGNNPRLLKYVYEMNCPVTLSVLPHLPFSRKIAEEASSHHLGVMLHMPMQPKNKKVLLEPKTILITTPDGEIQNYLEGALLSVPNAQGVNNHMGSAATTDLRVMRVVMRYLKSKNLFFVDSNVISTTVGPRVARETGILFGKRDVFIDNEANAVSIKKQLKRAKKLALLNGRVVVIGHDKELTLKTIQEIVPEFEKEGIRFVFVKDAVESL